MSATGFHPEPSAKAPWTRTIVLTAAYAGNDAARAVPVRRARIKQFMVQHHKMLATVSVVWLVHETIPTGHARLISSSGITFHLGHSMTAAHGYGVCNFQKRGAFAMSKKNWDRVPIDAQSVDAPLSRAAVFLVVTAASELTALTKVCLALDGLDDLVKAVGFRDLSARLSCIVGIGRSLWDRLHFDKKPLEQIGR